MADVNPNPDTGLPLSYIFGGNTGLTLPQIEQRRRIMAALASRNRGFPKNVGEGMTYLGESIGEGLQDLALTAKEREYYNRRLQDMRPGGPSNPIYTGGQTSAEVPVKATPGAGDKVSAVDPFTQLPQGAAVFPETPLASPMTRATFADRFPSKGVLTTTAGAWPDAEPGPTKVTSAGADVPTPPPRPAATADDFGPDIVGGYDKGAAFGSEPDAPTFSDRFSAVNDTTSDKPTAATAAPQMATRDVGTTTDAPTPAGIALPSGADVPLPHGDPRTTAGVRATMEAELSQGGLTPTAIQGVERNVRDESNFNPNLRHPDQPKFSGEAHYAHGLYQEGGTEWNNYVNWLNKNAPGSDWRDPALQSRFLAQNLQKPQYQDTLADMNTASRPGIAADAFLRGYLKPAAPYMRQRSAAYLGEDGGGSYGNRQIAQGGDTGTLTRGVQMGTGVGDGRVGGAPVEDDSRDLVTAALLGQQQAQDQQKPNAPQSSQDDSETYLRDVMGLVARSGILQRPTAALGRAGVASDAGPLPVLSPMGKLGGAPVPPPAAAQSLPGADQPSPRDAVAAALLQRGQDMLTQRAQAGAEPVPPVAAAAPQSPVYYNPPAVSDAAGISPVAGQQLAQANQAQAPGQDAWPVQPLVTLPQVPPQFQKPLQEPVQPDPRDPRFLPGQADAQWIYKKAMYPGDPDMAAVADWNLKLLAEQRAAAWSIANEKYKRELEDFSQTRAKWQDPKLQGELTQQSLANQKSALEQQAQYGTWGGLAPEKGFEMLNTERQGAMQAANTLNDYRIALRALNEGVITGWGQQGRFDVARARAFITNNPDVARTVDSTETLRAMLKRGIGSAMEEVRGGGQGRVSPALIDIAKEAGGADPNMTEGTIRELLNFGAAQGYRKLNDYQSHVDQYLGPKAPGGMPSPAEAIYKFDTGETARPEITQRMLTNQHDHRFIEDYNREFGEGAAQYEIAKAAREARRRGNR